MLEIVTRQLQSAGLNPPYEAQVLRKPDSEAYSRIGQKGGRPRFKRRCSRLDERWKDLQQRCAASFSDNNQSKSLTFYSGDPVSAPWWIVPQPGLPLSLALQWLG